MLAQFNSKKLAASLAPLRRIAELSDTASVLEHYKEGAYDAGKKWQTAFILSPHSDALGDELRVQLQRQEQELEVLTARLQVQSLELGQASVGESMLAKRLQMETAEQVLAAGQRTLAAETQARSQTALLDYGTTNELAKKLHDAQGVHLDQVVKLQNEELTDIRTKIPKLYRATAEEEQRGRLETQILFLLDHSGSMLGPRWAAVERAYATALEAICREKPGCEVSATMFDTVSHELFTHCRPLPCAH